MAKADKPVGYCKRKNELLSYTCGRYSYNALTEELIDNTTGNVVTLDRFDNYQIEHPFLGSISKLQAWMLSKKPLNINPYDAAKAFMDNKVDIIQIGKNINEHTCFWKYHIESSFYKGYYYIPGFTRYVINAVADIIDTKDGTKPEPFTLDNLSKVNLRSDMDENTIVDIHLLLAYTFLPFTEIDVLKNVWFKNGSPNNIMVTNIGFFSNSEMGELFKIQIDKTNSKGIPIYYRAIGSDEYKISPTQAQVYKDIGVPKSTLQDHLSREPLTSTIKGYIVAYLEKESDIHYLNELDGRDLDERGAKLTNSYEVKDINDQLIQFPRQKDLIAFLIEEVNVSDKTIRRAIAKSENKPFKLGDFIIRHLNNTTWEY